MGVRACLSTQLRTANIDVFRFLDEDDGVIAKNFRKLCDAGLGINLSMYSLSRDSQMAVRQVGALVPRFGGGKQVCGSYWRSSCGSLPAVLGTRKGLETVARERENECSPVMD